MSKWLVGSSRSKTSGRFTNACANKARRLRPPDSVPRLSLGFNPTASISVMARLFKSQPFWLSRLSCNSLIAWQACISPLVHCWLNVSYCLSKSATGLSPAITSSSTFCWSLGTSWASIAMVMLLSIIISPSSGLICPLMSLSRVDLPSPFLPIKHTRSPAFRLKLTWSKTGAIPKACETFFSVISAIDFYWFTQNWRVW